jgi:hypothetical protein
LIIKEKPPFRGAAIGRVEIIGRAAKVGVNLHHLCGQFGYRPGFLANGLTAGLPVHCAAL